ncbi:MAG: hypothetical protein LBP54_07935 [Campylobacteraceae bacterium]|jgi:hypothetical protein|nr:hypothetical protein [Campylobacteraceae bacterium]
MAMVKKILLTLTLTLTFLFSISVDLQNTSKDGNFSIKMITNEVILDWWGRHSDEKFDILTKPMPFFAKDKEKAFLVEAGVFHGRNDWLVAALIIPKTQEVKILDKNIIRQDIKVIGFA